MKYTKKIEIFHKYNNHATKILKTFALFISKISMKKREEKKNSATFFVRCCCISMNTFFIQVERKRRNDYSRVEKKKKNLYTQNLLKYQNPFKKF